MSPYVSDLRPSFRVSTPSCPFGRFFGAVQRTRRIRIYVHLSPQLPATVPHRGSQARQRRFPVDRPPVRIPPQVRVQRVLLPVADVPQVGDGGPSQHQGVGDHPTVTPPPHGLRTQHRRPVTGRGPRHPRRYRLPPLRGVHVVGVSGEGGLVEGGVPRLGRPGPPAAQRLPVPLVPDAGIGQSGRE